MGTDAELDRLRSRFPPPWKFTRAGARIRAERGTYTVTCDPGDVGRTITEWMGRVGLTRTGNRL